MKSSWLMLRRGSETTIDKQNNRVWPGGDAAVTLYCWWFLVHFFFVCVFLQAGLWNSPAALSMISDLMMLPRCKRHSIATHLITYDIADLFCQFAFITYMQENHTSHAATHSVIFFKTRASERSRLSVWSRYCDCKVPVSPKDLVCFSDSLTQILQWIFTEKSVKITFILNMAIQPSPLFHCKVLWVFQACFSRSLFFSPKEWMSQLLRTWTLVPTRLFGTLRQQVPARPAHT